MYILGRVSAIHLKLCAFTSVKTTSEIYCINYYTLYNNRHYENT